MKRTLAVTKNNTFAHVVLSAAFAQQHRWDEASVEFSKAVRLEESPFVETAIEREYRVRTHLLLAQIFEQRDRQDDALTHYHDALRLDPASVEAHNNLGNLLDKMGKTDEALAQYHEALRLKAIALAQAAGVHDWVRDMQQRLQLYQSGRRYREASTSLPPTAKSS